MSNISETIQMVYRAKGDLLEVQLVNGLMSRGVDEDRARAAARTCSNRVLRNGMLSGAVTGLIVGAIGTPVAGGVAGAAMAGVAAHHTFLQSDACREVRAMSDLDVHSLVDQVLRGF